MLNWSVQDRYGNDIYMTPERWSYILRYHHELGGLLDDVLDTLRKGQRIFFARNRTDDRGWEEDTIVL